MSGLYVPDVPSMGLRGSGLTPSQGGGGSIIAWILRTGLWNDASPWNDTQLWKDS